MFPGGKRDHIDFVRQFVAYFSEHLNNLGVGACAEDHHHTLILVQVVFLAQLLVFAFFAEHGHWDTWGVNAFRRVFEAVGLSDQLDSK